MIVHARPKSWLRMLFAWQGTALSLIWKRLVVNRIYDEKNDTLIYLSHSRQVQDGSAKMAISTVPLYGQDVTWATSE